MGAQWKTRHMNLVGVMLSPLIVLFAQAASAGPASTAPTKEPVTFSKDIAPIFQAKCQECHQPNSIAPMSLITYKEVRPWARSIRERVVTRQMPPWHIDPSVGVQKFKNDMSLTDEQVATIARWMNVEYLTDEEYKTLLDQRKAKATQVASAGQDLQ